MAEEVQVIIVGGGPIGLTLSCILGKNNIQHVLLEKNDSTTIWPKSILTNPRSMELYRQMGLDGVLRKHNLSPHSRIAIGKSLTKEPLIQIPLAQMTGKNPQKNADDTYTFDEQWTTESVLRLSQIYIEPILKEVASEYKSSEIKFGWKVEAISQNEEHVIIEAVNVESGERKVYHALYAVGCDGGKSFVRKSLGIRFKGEFDLADMKSISFESKELKARLADDLLGKSIAKKDMFVLTLSLDNKGLFVSHFLQYPKDLAPEGIVKELLEEDIPYNIVFHNDWQGHFASAETFQQGRVFLAGDACHVMVPIGGFGMNTGVQDAFDIGWKLVATLKGWGGDKLLSSYTTERLQSVNKVLSVIKQIFYFTRKYTGLMLFLLNTQPFSFVLKRFIDSSSLDVGAAGVLFGIRLTGSPLCIPSDTSSLPEDITKYTPVAYPGCRAPHYRFEDGSAMHDKLGSAFTLLHLLPSDKSHEPLTSAAGQSGIPVKVLSLKDPKLKALYGEMDFVLIRPDMYIAWCGNKIPTLRDENINEGAKVLMKVVTGATTLPSEWQRKRKDVRPIWHLLLLVSLLIGVIAVVFGFWSNIRG